MKHQLHPPVKSSCLPHRPSSFRPLFLLFFFLFHLGDAESLLAQRVQVAPGIYRNTINRPHVPVVIHALELNVARNDVYISTTLAHNRLGSGSYQNTQTQANNHPGNVIGAINADFFQSASDPYTYFNNLMIKDNEYVVGKAYSFAQFGMRDDGVPFISNMNFSGSAHLPDKQVSIDGVNRPRGSNQAIVYNRYIGNNTRTNSHGIEVLLERQTMARTGTNVDFVVRNIADGVGNMAIPANHYVLSANGTKRTEITGSVKVGDVVSLVLGGNIGADNIAQLVGGDWQVVTNGVLYPCNHSRHPRTLVGYSQNRDWVYFVVIDGRQTASRGATLEEAGRIMRDDFGAWNAVNLDGGGSSTMIINNQLINRPEGGTYQRPVANALVAISGAETRYHPVTNRHWQRAKYGGVEALLPDWFGSNTERGVAYVPEGDDGVMLVQSAEASVWDNADPNNYSLRRVNAKTGADLGTMNLSGYSSGGIFHFSDVATSEDNRIFLANYGRTESDGFKVWMYDSTGDTNPLLVLDDSQRLADAQWQLGRTITVTGNYTAGTAVIYAVSDGGNNRAVRYTQKGPGQPFDTDSPAVFTLSNVGTNPTASGITATSQFYQTGRGQPVRKYNNDGTLAGTIPTGVVSAEAHRVYYLGIEHNLASDYIAVYNGSLAGGHQRHRAKLVRVPAGNPALAYVVETTQMLGNAPNDHAVGDARFVYKGDGSGNAAFDIYMVATNNGIGAYRTKHETRLIKHWSDEMPDPDPDPDPDPEPDPNRIVSIPYHIDNWAAGLPDGWAKIGNVETYNGWRSEFHTALEFPPPIADGPTAILPPIDDAIDISGLDFSFKAYATSIYDIDHIKVGFISDPADASTFTLVEEVPLTTSIQTYSVGLGNHVQSAGRRVALMAASGGAWNRFIVGEVELQQGTPVVSSRSEQELPQRFELSQNYPNPFNPATVISYALPMESYVRLSVYDITGRQITSLVEEVQPAGTYDVTWDAGTLSSGIYIYRLVAGGETLTRRMTLVK